MAKLTRLEINGFKSIDGEGQSLDLGPVTVLTLRQKCAHFAEWRQRLEGLANANT